MGDFNVQVVAEVERHVERRIDREVDDLAADAFRIEQPEGCVGFRRHVAVFCQDLAPLADFQEAHAGALRRFLQAVDLVLSGRDFDLLGCNL